MNPNDRAMVALGRGVNVWLVQRCLACGEERTFEVFGYDRHDAWERVAANPRRHRDAGADCDGWWDWPRYARTEGAAA